MNTPDKTKIIKNDRLRKDSGFKDKKIAIYVGGFQEERGLEVLVESAKYLPEEVGVVLLGYGELEENLKKEIEQKGLSKKVKILPAVPYKDLLNYIADADVAVYPMPPVSKNNIYSLPNKFFEFIHAELPIVVTNKGTMSGLVEKYQIGLTIEPENAQATAEAIQRILKDKKVYQKYKETLSKAKEDFCWEHESEKLRRIYAGLENK